MHTLNRLTTGNLWFALPRIGPPPGGLDRLSFLMMGHRGLIELLAGDGQPFLAADARIGGKPAFSRAEARCVAEWLPVYSAASPQHEARLTWLAPHDERGWLCRLEVRNTSATACEAEMSFSLRWGQTCITTYDPEPLTGRLSLDPNGWGGGIALGWVAARTEFALGVGCSEGGQVRLAVVDEATGDVAWEGNPAEGACRRFEAGMRAELRCSRVVRLEPGTSAVFELYASVAADTKAACLSARYLREMGFVRLLEATHQRLAALNAAVPEALDTDAVLGPLVRRNRLFCYFYSLGRALDTEELCPVTSRSSDYHVSAAYWDRDALLWSFPTVLHMDRVLAAEMLEVAFGRQGRNIGTHSRFIDGSVYEPGFELDELCAPLLALDRYLRATDDWSVLSRIRFDERAAQIARTLAARQHAEITLFSTDYLPTDDLAQLPYCTYDNVLVWAACGAMARIARRRKDSDTARHWAGLRDRVAEAVWAFCVTGADGEKVFAWSTDLRGRYRLYDEPPGSLTLLAWLGFCTIDDPVFRATVRWIYSPRNAHYFPQADEVGCLHEAHPWILAVSNSLLLPDRRTAALNFLRTCPMDEGFACETVHEDTGRVVSGRHFATCAGFLANALVEAYAAAPHGEPLPAAR